MLNEVYIRGLGRPGKHLDAIAFKPLFCLGGMFGVIILLKYPILLWYLQLVKAFLQSIIQNVTVLLCIHGSLNLYELSYPIPAHTPPYNKIIPSFMLDCGYGGLIKKLFTLLFSGINPLIWPNPVDLGLIWQENPLPVIHCPVIMVFDKLETIYLMLLFKYRAFLLDYRAKIVFLEYISDCLGGDKVEDDVVNGFGGLNSIIEPSSSDLMHDTLFIMKCELGRMTPFVMINHLVRLNSGTNSRLGTRQCLKEHCTERTNGIGKGNRISTWLMSQVRLAWWHIALTN